jgi:predicted ATPase
LDVIFCGFVWCGINTFMNQYKNTKDRQQTDAWLKSNGIGVNQIYVGTAELFQAQKLATYALKQHGNLLEQNQAAVLNNFLRAARGSKRDKITQGQCFKVLNITKQAQRKYAKLMKQKNAG